MGIWMIGVSGYLFHINGKLKTLDNTNGKLMSDVDSIESVLVSTDGNVAEVIIGMAIACIFSIAIAAVADTDIEYSTCDRPATGCGSILVD